MRFAPLLLLASLVAAGEWVQVAEFQPGQAPSAIYANAGTVAAWSGTGLWVSTDAGRSWNGPTAPVTQAGGNPVGIRTVRVGADGIYLLAIDATLWTAQGGGLAPLGQQATGLAVDGQGHAWAQGQDGRIRMLPGGQPTIQGSLYVPVRDGVLVQRGKDLALATAAGERPVELKLQDGPPFPSRIAPVSAGAGDEWLTKDGHLWKIYDGRKVMEASERAVDVLVTAWTRDGMHELVRYQERTAIYRPAAGGRQVHVRSADMPADVAAMTIASSSLLVVTPTGIWLCAY